MKTWRGNPWAIIVVLCLGYFATLMDLTIVNIAVPQMTDDLNASLDQILWVFNSYALGLAVLLITAGRLGDLLGKKNVFIAGVVVFTLASLACGLAQDPAQLIAFRAVQGVGGALLVPQTLSIIADVFPASKRGAALGIWGAVAGLSAIAGPVVGGALVTSFDWRWIFLINVPIGVAVVALAGPVIPRSIRQAGHKLDITGVLIVSMSLFCLAFGLIQGERYGWNAWVWGLLALSVVLFLAFVAQQSRVQDDDPLVPFSLFKDRAFSIVNAISIVVSFGAIGLFLPMTVYLQSVLGFSAVKTGGVLLPMAIGGLIVAVPAGVLSERYGGKYVLIAGLSTFGIGLAWLVAVAQTDSTWTAFIAPFFVVGLGSGCSFTPMASEVMRKVPAHLNGAASGVNNAMRHVGAVLAGAVIGAVLQNRLAASLTSQANEHAAALPEEYREGFIAGFAESGAEGLNVGASGASSVGVPEGMPDAVAAEIQAVAGQVFAEGYVAALTPTLLVAVAALAAGVLGCFALKAYTGPVANPYGLPVVDDAEPGSAEHELEETAEPAPTVSTADNTGSGH
nr:MFS transporter [Phytoactinopolyspora mesophila]